MVRPLWPYLTENLIKLEKCGAVFYDVALTQDPDSKMYVYDTEKSSTCLHSVTVDLLAITV